DALRGTFLFANLACHAAQPGVRVVAVKNQKGEVASGFLRRQTFFGVLHRCQPVLFNVAADEVAGSLRETFDNTFAKHPRRMPTPRRKGKFSRSSGIVDTVKPSQ